MRFKGRVAIVTGSGRGIGKETALMMASEGARVTINDIDGNLLEHAKADIVRRTGAEVLAVQADVTAEDQVARVVAGTVATFGGIDVLVNVVGGTYPSTERFLEAITDEDWHKLIDLNLTSHFLCVREVLPHMQRRRYGRIVGVSSIAALCGEPLGWSPAYAAAKAGVLGLTRQIAIELGPYGIAVNALAQSDTMTERTYEHFSGAWPETQDEFLARYARYPLGYPAQPIDIARVIVFLASDEAKFVNGETVLVTGGAYIE